MTTAYHPYMHLCSIGYRFSVILSFSYVEIDEETYLNRRNFSFFFFAAAGDYGLSSLDKPPAELYEIEKLLLNIDSYPAIRVSHPNDKKPRPSTAQMLSARRAEERSLILNDGNNGNNGNNVNDGNNGNNKHVRTRQETLSTSGKYNHNNQHGNDGNNYFPNENNNDNMSYRPESDEPGIVQISSERQPITKHSVKRFMSAGAKEPKVSIYGTSRRKASMKSVPYKSRNGPILADTSTEKFHRFLQKQVRPFFFALLLLCFCSFFALSQLFFCSFSATF